ncbi:MAG: hypothetical protein ABGZ17_16360, partial [Planctomycetaceae bacterium]
MSHRFDSSRYRAVIPMIAAAGIASGSWCVWATPPADSELEVEAEARVQLVKTLVELAQGPGPVQQAAQQPVEKSPKAAKSEQPQQTEPVPAKAAPAKSTEPKSTEPKSTEPKAAGAKPPVAPSNPLKDVIRKLFPKNSPRKPLLPKLDGLDLIPADEDRVVRDPIDALGPHDPHVASALRSVQQQIDAQRWQQALEILQKILERSDDSLVRTQGGRSLSVRVVANRLLGGLNQELLKNYRLQHGGRAEQLLAEAQQNGDPQLLVRVATLYFHTSAGYQAANHLGSLHFDRGEFAMASKWYLQLLTAKTDHVANPTWRLKAAVALREAGHRKQSLQLLERVSESPTIELGGQTVDSKAWFQSLKPLSLQSDLPLDDWGMLYGSASRTGTAQGSDPVLLPRWSHPLTRNEDLSGQISDLMQDLTDEKR